MEALYIFIRALQHPFLVYVFVFVLVFVLFLVFLFFLVFVFFSLSCNLPVVVLCSTSFVVVCTWVFAWNGMLLSLILHEPWTLADLHFYLI